MASISIRESIRWLPEEAHEPTSTIVLTSPGKRFVDLRILHNGDFINKGKGTVPPEALDWAIAGSSSSRAAPERGPEVRWAQWKHWVDSRTLDVENATDEGYMSPLGRTRTLEVGSMVNPATGAVTDYEEIWVDEDPQPAPGDGGAHVAVLDFEGADGDASQRGRVVKLGKYCQGLLRHGDAVTLERWEWKENKGWWRSKASAGTTGLPCEMLLNNWNGSEGETVELEGRTWTVVEASKLQMHLRM